MIRVVVVAEETGNPLSGVVVAAHPSELWGYSWTKANGSHASVGESALTASDGTAELGERITVEANSDVSTGTVEVAPLKAGDIREARIRLKTLDDLTVFVRLVDAESKARIRDGVVWFDAGMLFADPKSDPPRGDEHDKSEEIHSSSDGLLEIHGRSWGQLFVSAKANGYARAVFILERGHEKPERALEVQLLRSAALQITVLNRGVALKGAKVIATTDADHLKQRADLSNLYCTSNDPTWIARTSANGRVEFSDLPPHVPLTLTVWVSNSEPHNQGEPVTLKPGEVRSMDVRLGAGATILGSIADSAGSPIAGYILWRVDEAEPKARILGWYETPAASTKSDADGRFRFEDVPIGSWLVGPQPPEHGQPAAQDPTAFPALAQLVRVEPGISVVDIAIRLERGLYLSGKVLGASGEPARDAHIEAFRLSASEQCVVDATSMASGSFTLGPLPAGTYTVFAQCGAEGQVHSEMLSVMAGNSDIVLRLRKAAMIRGTIVDASHAPQEGVVTIANVVDSIDSLDVNDTQTQEGKFQFPALGPGSFVLSCRTSQGLCGRSGMIQLAEGQAVDALEIVMTRGATLALRYEGTQARAHCRALLDGSMFSWTFVDRNKSASLVVPAGQLELLWSDVMGSAEESLKIETSAGLERSVVLTRK
ncbi:MAG TPA: carboxypeptidase-like regulatory domain-containing protein [Planctomycetota bacterium]|nr:carboxypeptidase-like regulatory domain-containing protein [Planctomycetota bacterium]